MIEMKNRSKKYCRNVTGDSSELCQFIRENNGLYLSDGSEYRDGGGFLRMNPMKNMYVKGVKHV